MKKRLALGILLLGLITTITASELDKEYQAVTRLKRGDTLPTYTLLQLDGTPIEFTAKGPTLVSIFTTWCSVCKVELKELNKDLASLPETASINVVAINAGETKKKVKKYKTRRNLTMPFLIDNELNMTKDLHVMGTPAVLLFDKDNRLIYQGSELPKTWINAVTTQ